MFSVSSIRFASVAALAACASLTACGGDSAPVVTSPTSPCSYQNAKIALISPLPGATGVPDAFPQVIVATSVAFPNSYDAVVTGNVGGVLQTVYFNTFIPSALPAGATAPPFANPIYYASTNPSVTFDTKSPISVALNDSASTCLPGSAIGTFTVL